MNLTPKGIYIMEETTTVEQRIAQLETDLRILEDAMDASIADRKLLHADLDTLTDVLLKLVKRLATDQMKKSMVKGGRSRS